MFHIFQIKECRLFSQITVNHLCGISKIVLNFEDMGQRVSKAETQTEKPSVISIF